MRDAERADQKVLRCDLDGARNEGEVLEAVTDAFGLRANGKGLESLQRSMTALKPLDADRPGFVVILENLPNNAEYGPQQRDALLDVFREAADFFFDRDTSFRVFYSIARAI
ncbi:MAG: barstar family protein [Burkholderiales bacterium]|nr:MAG: barstar family protein [Burkholderiales bacterium]